MKPYIADAFRDGKYVLAFQVENSSSLPLPIGVLSNSICSLAFPAGHSCKEAWIVQLDCDSELVFEFSAASTNVGGWREIGSLNIGMHLRGSSDLTLSSDFEEHRLSDFKIVSVERLVYEEDGLMVENGIIFTSQKGEEVWIAAAAAPGSVSIKAPFCQSEFSPELAIQHCRRVRIASSPN